MQNSVGLTRHFTGSDYPAGNFMVFRSFLSKSSWFFPELGKWVSQESTPLADLEEGFLKIEERGNPRKIERVQKSGNATYTSRPGICGVLKSTELLDKIV